MLTADEIPVDGAELDVPDVGDAVDVGVGVGEVGVGVGDVGVGVGEVGVGVGDVGVDVGLGEAFLVGAAEVWITLVGATDWPGAAGWISAVAEGVLLDARALGCVDGTAAAADVAVDAVADGDGAVGPLLDVYSTKYVPPASRARATAPRKAASTRMLRPRVEDAGASCIGKPLTPNGSAWFATWAR
jgi:hypothetical protein